MKCPYCGQRTDVLQTFPHDDHIVRVRGHRDQSKCWMRTRTVERYDTYKPDSLVEGAQNTALELRQIISQLKDFDLRLKRALNMDTLVNVLTPDTDCGKIDISFPSE